MSDPKLLSPAQQKHLAALLAERDRATLAVQQFVTYLYAEHEVSMDQYPIIDAVKGFLPKEAT